MNRFIVALLVSSAAFVAISDASPLDLPGLSAVSGLLSTAVQQVGTVEKPVNGVLKSTGLATCDRTLVLTEYIGQCIPARFKCVGVDVLNKVTGTLVSIPACPDSTEAAAVVVQQQVTPQQQVLQTVSAPPEQLVQTVQSAAKV